MTLLGALINLRSGGGQGPGMYRVFRTLTGTYVKGRYVGGPTALVIPDDVVDSVDAAADTLTLTAHGLSTGDGPLRLTTTGTLPAGLATSTDYWVIRIDDDTIRLATSVDNAVEVIPAAIAIDITSAGTGVHTLLGTFVDHDVDAVDGGADTLTITGHGLITGSGPLHLETTGTLPGGLLALTDYWIVVLDADTIQLALSHGNALALGPVVNITSAGTGTHTLVDVAETQRLDYSTFAFTGSVQPLSGRILEYMPEGQSGDEDKLVFTSTRLRVREPGVEPDLVEFDDEEYLVTVVNRWQGPSTTHYQCVISRLEVP